MFSKDPFGDAYGVPKWLLKGPHGPFQGDADGIIFGKFSKLALVAPNRLTGMLAWGRNSTAFLVLGRFIEIDHVGGGGLRGGGPSPNIGFYSRTY